MARLVIITGATRGLGRALVDGLVEAGQTVAGCGTKSGLVAELSRRYGPPHSFSAVDVTDGAAVERWAKDVIKRLGPPDILVNNAGVINKTAPLWEVSEIEMAQVIAINILGVTNVIRSFVPAMIANKRGVVVNLSSGWGRSVDAGEGPYCASKWAIEGLTKTLAEELPAGMAAVPLNPGIIDTDMLRSCWADGASSYPPPEEWAKKAVPLILKLGAKDSGKSLSV